MKAMSFVLFIFAVAGLAVAAEQPKPITVGDCTCTGIRKSTGKPWTESECRSACETKRMLGDSFSNLANPSLNPGLAAGSQSETATTNSHQSAGLELTRQQVIEALLAFIVLAAGAFAFGTWKIMKSGPKRKKRTYATDQHKLVAAGSTADTVVAHSEIAVPEPTGSGLAVVATKQPPPTAVETRSEQLEEIVDVTNRSKEMDGVVAMLENWANPEVYRWAHWGKGLSQFTLDNFGFQPEMTLFSGGIEMSVQAEHERAWFEIITFAIQDRFPVSLKLVILEQTQEGCVMVLMPEESVRFALLGESNVLTLTEGLRQHLLPSVVHEHKRLANQ